MITNQYTYNGDGQRVQIVDSQGTKKQIWDGENILLETDGSDVTQAVYTLEPAGYGNLISQRRGSATSTHLFDALGSTRKLTDSTGAVSDSYDYRAYGEMYASSGTTTNVFRWVGGLGYYYDVDRLAYYLRARTYSPALARFLSQDPIGFVGSPWNLYEYVNSKPILFIDPSGLLTLQECYEKCRRGWLICLGLGALGCGEICAGLLIRCAISPWPINLIYCGLAAKCMFSCMGPVALACTLARAACEAACIAACEPADPTPVPEPPEPPIT